MNKKFVILGMAVLLICIGLSGCNEQNDDDNIISVEELNSHLAKYIGKEITVDGYLININDYIHNTKLGGLVDNPENPTYEANTYIIRMSKQKLTLSINEKLLAEARENEINISSFLEIRLNEYFALLDGKSQNNQEEVFGTAFSIKAVCGRRDLNPGNKLGKLK